MSLRADFTRGLWAHNSNFAKILFDYDSADPSRSQIFGRYESGAVETSDALLKLWLDVINIFQVRTTLCEIRIMILNPFENGSLIYRKMNARQALLSHQTSESASRKVSITQCVHVEIPMMKTLRYMPNFRATQWYQHPIFRLHSWLGISLYDSPLSKIKAIWKFGINIVSYCYRDVHNE